MSPLIQCIPTKRSWDSDFCNNNYTKTQSGPIIGKYTYIYEPKHEKTYKFRH